MRELFERYATGQEPHLDRAQEILGDFTIFWAGETDPAAKRQFLSHVFGSIWLDHDRIVRPTQALVLPFSADQRPRTAEEAGVTRTRIRHHIEIRREGRAH